MLIALTVWFVLVISFVAFCRVAAAADAREADLAHRYPSASDSTAGAGTLAAGLVIWDEQPSLVLADLRARVPGAPGRAERYVAGS
jgi:hypothetical protein